MPKVSIIVPCYNVAPYVARCLDSLINQTLCDIEIICIDDKSTDNTLEILCDYAKRDKRINVIAQERNCGVSVARNVGLDRAQSEYIGFVDPDDYVDLDFYEKLYHAACATDADIAKGEVSMTTVNGETFPFGPAFAKIKENKAQFYYAFWSAIYRHTMLKHNNVCFDKDLIIREDILFCIQAVYYANKIECVTGTKYNYVRVLNSLDSTYLSKEKLRSNISSISKQYDFLNDVAMPTSGYDYLYIGPFYDLIYDIFNRCLIIDAKLEIVRAAMRLYNKCKYKSAIIQSTNHALVRILETGDEVGLLKHLILRSLQGIHSYKLFNFIPIFSVDYRYDRDIWRVFGIKIMKVRKKDNIYYRLFGFLPILKKEAM